MLFLNLVLSITLIAMCIVWMCRNRACWLYLFPVFFGTLHYVIYYTVFLLAFFGAFGWHFKYHFFLDWGSLCSQHVLVTGVMMLFNVLINRIRPRFGLGRYPQQLI